jgi:recombination protein RecT
MTVPNAAAPTITDLMKLAAHRIKPFIPSHMSAEEVTQQVYWAAKKNPEILKCTGDSIVHAVVTILDWGLIIGRTAFLVPYRTKGRMICTPVAHYKGLAELMIASRAVRYVEAHTVFENDLFTYKLGLAPVLEHLPDGNPATRGLVKGAYCILTLPGGIKVFEHMSVHDIDAIRNTHSKQWTQEKVGNCPPWYAEKTVVRATAGLVPTNPKLAKAMRVIEEDRAAEMSDAEDVTASAEVTTAAAPKAPAQLRVRVINPMHPMAGKQGTFLRRLTRSSQVWIRMDEEIPAELRSFAVDDARGRARDIVLFPDECEAI